MAFPTRFFLLLSLVFLSLSGQGQVAPTPRISGQFAGLSFEQFAQQIESRTNYRFYFNPAAFDSLTVNLQVREQPLEAVLDELFRGTAYQYAIDSDRRVFATKGVPLQGSLPQAYFSRQIETPTSGEVPEHLTRTVTTRRQGEAEGKLYEIGTKTREIQPGNSNLVGRIVDAKSGEPVIGAVVYIEEPWTATATSAFGQYSINLPRGPHTLIIKSIGMRSTKRKVMVYGDGRLDLTMDEDLVALKEVVIESGKDANVSGLQMGVERLDIKTLKQVPTALGEVDVMRVVLTLPGVKSVGESSTGLNVRGGATDQNLILFNDAVIYNPSHLFGFFSAFNPDVVKGVELHKSSVPAKYGGRLSSVLDVTTREGNKKKIEGSGGIGLITGRLTLEGPIIKDKTSFLVGGRSTYSNWLLQRIPDRTLQNSSASFYDVNANISHQFDEKNSLHVSGYRSADQFRFGRDTTYQYQNQTASIKWNRIFRNNLFGVFTGSYSGYNFGVKSTLNPVNAYELQYSLQQTSLKADFSYFPRAKHSVDFGASTTRYRMRPGSIQPIGPESLVLPDVLAPEQGQESALYLSDRYDISARLSVSVGLRYSFYQYLGAREVFRYAQGLPRELFTLQDTVSYGRGKVINNYHGPEYRVSARYALSDNSSLKFGYTRMRQYLHMLSNTTSISPTDTWKLSDPHLKPQVGDQVSVGFYKNLKNNTIETSVETYYKTMDDVLDFKGGANLTMNHHIETDVVGAEGKAYGVEVLVKKLTGKINGWVSYTYSRTLLRPKAVEMSEQINQGAFYPANYDKPHDLTMIGNYRFSRRFSTSLNFTYSTGRPITPPIGIYELGGAKRIIYADRNQFRIDDFYRFDFAMNIEGNHKVQKLSHSSWTLSVYNLTGRRNPFSVYFRSEGGTIKGYKLSIFGQPIPSITYNFRF